MQYHVCFYYYSAFPAYKRKRIVFVHDTINPTVFPAPAELQPLLPHDAILQPTPLVSPINLDVANHTVRAFLFATADYRDAEAPAFYQRLRVEWAVAEVRAMERKRHKTVNLKKRQNLAREL